MIVFSMTSHEKYSGENRNLLHSYATLKKAFWDDEIDALMRGFAVVRDTGTEWVTYRLKSARKRRKYERLVL